MGPEFRSELLEITKCGGICFGCSRSLVICFKFSTDVPVRVTKHFGFQCFLCAVAPQRMEIKHLPFFLSIDLEVHPFQSLLGASRRKREGKRKPRKNLHQLYEQSCFFPPVKTQVKTKPNHPDLSIPLLLCILKHRQMEEELGSNCIPHYLAIPRARGPGFALHRQVGLSSARVQARESRVSPPGEHSVHGYSQA